MPTGMSCHCQAVQPNSHPFLVFVCHEVKTRRSYSASSFQNEIRCNRSDKVVKTVEPVLAKAVEVGSKVPRLVAARAICVEDKELPIATPRGMIHSSAVLPITGTEASPPEPSAVCSADLDATLLVFESYLADRNNYRAERNVRTDVGFDLASDVGDAPQKQRHQQYRYEA